VVGVVVVLVLEIFLLAAVEPVDIEQELACL